MSGYTPMDLDRWLAQHDQEVREQIAREIEAEMPLTRKEQTNEA